MQPKNLREKWGMNHFWKYISPKSVLLHILYPFQYATKGFSLNWMLPEKNKQEQGYKNKCFESSYPTMFFMVGIMITVPAVCFASNSPHQHFSWKPGSPASLSQAK